jgi:hypothetical protein
MVSYNASYDNVDCPANKCTKFLLNVANYTSVYIVSFPRIQGPSLIFIKFLLKEEISLVKRRIIMHDAVDKILVLLSAVSRNSLGTNEENYDRIQKGYQTSVPSFDVETSRIKTTQRSMEGIRETRNSFWKRHYIRP